MMIEAILISTFTTVTPYMPVKGQTDDSPTWTSIGDRTTMFGCAASRDLLKSGRVKYGDILLVQGYGFRVVNDTMNDTRCVAWQNHECAKRVPITNAIDLLVFTKAEEKKIKEQKLPVYKVNLTGGTNGR